MNPTRLSFDILQENDCKKLMLLDTSYYGGNTVVANATLQVISPFDETPVELNFTKNGITVLNSNTLGITNVNDFDNLSLLPDGLYTAKISICPVDLYWFEKSWYRTCLLECKYDKAFLKLKVQSCEACFSPENIKRLERARIYMYGAKVNAKNCNLKEADKLYKASDKILNSLLDNCEC